MIQPSRPINISEQGNLISFITYKQNLKKIIETKAVSICLGLRNHMKPTSPKTIFKVPFFSSVIFAHIYPLLIKIITEHFPWNKTEKTPTFTGIPPMLLF